MKDGLSQIERRQRIESLKPFAVTESDLQSLLKQAEKMARMIRYYDLKGKHDGYFNQFLKELKTINKDDIISGFSGNMEPAQALLYTFLHHLSHITKSFNERWNTYLYRYFNEILHVESQESRPDKTWITFTKNATGNVIIPPGTRFTYDKATPGNKIFYHLEKNVVVTDIEIAQAYALHFVKNPEVNPACLLNAPVSLKKTDLLENKKADKMLFDKEGNPGKFQPLGIEIISLSLLLREGHRFVTLSFQTEGSSSFVEILNTLSKQLTEKDKQLTKEEAERIITSKLLKDIFFLEISTADGWKEVSGVSIRRVLTENNENDSESTCKQKLLVLSFELPDKFPATTACNIAVHQKNTEFPALRILLNRDAWLYPYCWLKELEISKLEIKTAVSGISNILLYNELGKVDNSAPFFPFGMNTEKGTWFILGNYEMALKNIENIDISIKWQQLPENKGGLSEYYDGYNFAINNRSFKLQSQYLNDYKWKDTLQRVPLFLFSTKVNDKDGFLAADKQLVDESVLNQIRPEKMSPLKISEDDYIYNIRSRSGFFRFILKEPEMGFGEKLYRNLFSEQIIKRALKKKKTKLLNPPIMPLIERMTLSYTSTDSIDLTIFAKKDPSTSLLHLHPLGETQVYPVKRNKSVSFLHSLDTDANILLALKNVKGNEMLRLYFDFSMGKESDSSIGIPSVRWYWGNGYHWEILPDESVYKNTTKNFFTSGQINIHLPEIPDKSFYDENALIWLRAGITDKEESIPEINNIKTNVAKVYRDKAFLANIQEENFRLNVPEINIPGISGVEQITPFIGSITVESDTQKMMRVSEYVSHRGKVITARDYEQIVLQAFPEISKVKCLCHYDAGTNGKKPGKITLAVIPGLSDSMPDNLPYASSEQLLKIKEYLKDRVSASITGIEVVNPVYEQILVRCELEFDKINYPEISNAVIRTYVRKKINKLIAPWQYTGGSPSFGFSFEINDLCSEIEQLKQVKSIEKISVVQIYRDKDKKYLVREYTSGNEKIISQFPHAILVPSRNHTIIALSKNKPETLPDNFGINEMEINENFIICR